MTDVSLLFNLLAIDKVSNVLGDIKGNFGKLALGVAAGAIAAGAKMTEMAGDFEFSMTRLVTGAGETQGNLKLVSSGILDMAGKVGESTKALASGMYLIESAGFHGAEGLKVLEVAAEGAKVGNANMATVADAVTTALNAYHLGASHAAEATNALVAAEGQGKTNLEALSGSLSTVAPIAAVAHVGLNEVLAAMATMTAQGTEASSAATYLKQTIGQLSNPTAKAAMEMKALGLSAVQVGLNLSKNGLASTLEMITDAIQKKMGPAGTVLIQQLQKASSSTSDFQKVLANLPPTQQTYIGALATMTGGTKSMQAALELTGSNMQVFKKNTEIINEKVKEGGSSIEGWSLVQQTFNQKMAQAKESVNALAVRIGMGLLPVAETMLGWLMSAVQWGEKHATIVKITAAVVGELVLAISLYVIGVKIAAAATAIWDAIQAASPIGVMIVAIIALVVAFVYLWNHSAAFRNFWIALWHDIWGVLKAVGAWFAGPFAGFFVGVWHVMVDMWHGIVTAFDAVWSFLKAVGAWFAGPFAGFFVAAGQAIAAPFLWLWHNVIDPLWHAWYAGFSFVMNIVTSLKNLVVDLALILVMYVWNTMIKPAITNIAAIFMWLWQNVIMLAVAGIKLEWNGLVIIARGLWSELTMIFNMIAAAAMWLWQNGIMPAVRLIQGEFNVLVSAAMWLWHNGIEPAIHGAGAVFSWLWSEASSIFGRVAGVVQGLADKFRGVFSAIGGFISAGFSGAAGIVRGAVNDVIGVVNSAIQGVNSLISTADKLPGVNLPHIPTVPYLASGGDVMRGGLAVVGDRGAEVVSLPAGARVYPHGSGPSGQGGDTVYLRPGNEVGDFLIKILRQSIGARGGNPTIVLKPS